MRRLSSRIMIAIGICILLCAVSIGYIGISSTHDSLISQVKKNMMTISSFLSYS